MKWRSWRKTGIMKIKMQKIEISHRTIIFTVFFLIFLWLLVQIHQIILALFVALIIMAALNPLVDRLERLKLPRALAILTIYLLIFGGLGTTLGIIISPLIQQTTILIDRLPLFSEQFGFLGIQPETLASQFTALTSIPANLLKVVIGIFSNLVGILTVGVISFYLLLERKNLEKYLVVLFGKSEEKKAKTVIDKIEFKLGSWVRGEIILMMIVGFLDFLGLRFLGIEFALPIAILGGMLEIVPNIGPMVATAPAILAGLTVSPLHGAAAAGWYFLVQQAENSFIVPKVMRKITGLYPLITILALAVGFKLGGVAGAILSVPLVLTLQVISTEVIDFFPQFDRI